MQRIAVRVGGENSAAVRSVKDKMTRRLLNGTAAGCDEIMAIRKVGGKREVARTSQCTNECLQVLIGGCSKRSANKAAGEEKPQAYPLGTLRIFPIRERSWRPFSAGLLLPNLAAAIHHKFRARQFFESHRTSGMDACRTDPDLGA